MPIQQAATEESVLSNIALLKMNGRDILSEEALPDVRAAVDAMETNILQGLTTRGLASPQTTRVTRLVRRGGKIIDSGAYYRLNSKTGITMLVDEGGRLYYRYLDKEPEQIAEGALVQALAECPDCECTPCMCGGVYKGLSKEARKELATRIAQL